MGRAYLLYFTHDGEKFCLFSEQLSRTIDQHIQYKNKKQDKQKRKEYVAKKGILAEGSDFFDGGFHFPVFLDSWTIRYQNRIDFAKTQISVQLILIWIMK